MSLLDDALGHEYHQKCKIALITESGKVSTEELEKAFRADIPSTWISKALNERGIAISDKTIQKHRAGNCGYCNR